MDTKQWNLCVDIVSTFANVVDSKFLGGESGLPQNFLYVGNSTEMRHRRIAGGRSRGIEQEHQRDPGLEMLVVSGSTIIP